MTRPPDDWLHGPELGWFATRRAIWRDLARDAGERRWAMAEIVCAVVSLATLALSFGIVAVGLCRPLPAWATGWPIQLLMSGAVGYGTNFFAVQMLFRPREPYTSIPLRWIWRQGLIPAKQAEMAVVVGDQVARRLLTPEHAAGELTTAILSVLDDDATFREFVAGLAEQLEGHLPGSLDALLPELIELLEGPLADAASAGRVRTTLEEWIGKWLRDPVSRARVAEFCRRFLHAHSSMLVELLQRLVKRYKKSGSARSLAFAFGVRSNIIDWDDVETALRRVLTKPGGHVWIDRMIGHLAAVAPELIDKALDATTLADLRAAFVALAKGAVRDQPARELGSRILDLMVRDPRGVTFRDELRAQLRPALRTWIERGGLRPILLRFDVRARVAEAAAALDVRVLEDMANRIGAYHLAAIQVLGYVLGILAGSLLVAINLLAAPTGR